MKGRLFLDAIIRQGAAILQLPSGKDEALLVRGDALLALDLCLDIVNGVGSFHVTSDGLTRQGVDKDLHARRWLWWRLMQRW